MTRRPSRRRPRADQCDKENLPLLNDGTLTIATDSPAFHAVVRRRRPDQRRGLRVGGGVRRGRPARLRRRRGDVGEGAVQQLLQAGRQELRLRHQPDLDHPERAEVVDFSDGYYDAAQAVVALKGTAGADATSLADLKGLRLGAQTGTTSLTAIRDVIQPDARTRWSSRTPTPPSRRCRTTRSTRSWPTCRPRSTSPPSRSRRARIVGQFQPETGEQEEFGMLFEKGSELVPCVNEALADAEGGRHARPDRAAVALRRRGRPRAPVTRRTGWQPERPLELERRRLRTPRPHAARCWSSRPRRSVVVFAGARRRHRQLARAGRGAGDVLRLGRTRRRRSPRSCDGFWINVQLFLIAEPLILVLGAGGRAGPAGARRRGWRRCGCSRSVYTDLFRGIPTILLVVLLGVRHAGAASCRASRTACSSGRWSRWCCPTAPTSPRCSAPASSRSTPPRSPAPRRSRCPAARRCGSSWSRRPCAASYPRCSTTSSRCRRTPPWSRSVGVLRRGVRRPGLRQLQLQLHAARRGRGVLRRADRPAGAAHRLAAAAVRRSASSRGAVR